MLLAIVFGAVFFVVFAGLSGFVLSENRLQDEKYAKNEATSIAEAGLEYYRWFLAHNPGVTDAGTGHAGPYSFNYSDPEGGTKGTYALTITGNKSCNVITSIDLTSKGVPSDNTAVSQTLSARYAQPSVAAYSYILNDSVWAGADRIISGPYHSNGGIRMDGTANAPVSSSLATWTCTSSFGCSPDTVKAGVFGAGTNSSLWSYPTPQVDFSGIAANFGSLKSTAQANNMYFAKVSSGSSYLGYHLIFNSGGTVTIKKVTATNSLSGYPVDGSASGYVTENTLIKTESVVGTYTVPSTCGLIFVEDTVWVEGTVNQKVTLVAASVGGSGNGPDAILENNLLYNAYDGTNGLTLIAQHDILIAPDSPQNMTLDGIFVAQSGAFGRNLYACPSAYEPRGTLTILGTTVSNKRTGTKWLNGCNGGSSDAGYQTRIDAFDRRLATDPPPFTPITSTDYQFVDWQEK
jgi:hypothetical protein